MSYISTHNRLARERGSASNHLCECGEQAREWAYSNSSTQEEVDELGRRYSRDILNDYSPMCFRCHRLKDRADITACPQGHPYEGRNILLDAGKRKCRECHYARARARVRYRTPEARAKRNEYQRAYRARLKDAS